MQTVVYANNKGLKDLICAETVGMKLTIFWNEIADLNEFVFL